MPDPALSAAIKEAYAVAPAGQVILHTMEVRHPDFLSPIRVVRNFADQATWLNIGGSEVQAVLDGMEADEREQVGLVARLEAGAPVDAGQMVAFIALSFEFDMPPVDTMPVPEITVVMDNVGRELTDALDLAAVSQHKIEITYRPYLSTDINGPQMDPPFTMTLSEVEADMSRVTARARMLDIGNRAFPSRFYTASDFPMLAR